MPKANTKYNEAIPSLTSGLWERFEALAIWKLMLLVFAFGLSERLLVMLVLFLRYGWQTVSGIELWFYYGVAKGSFLLYSQWDPSWWILGGLGQVLSGLPLLYSVYLSSSVCSSMNAAIFCLFVSELHNRRAGLLAGIVYASAVLPMFNSAGTVTHDIFGYPYLILSLYGVLLAVRRPAWGWKVGGALICLAALFLGRHVGPTIFVAGGTLIIYLLWVAARGYTQESGLVRWLSLGITVGAVLTLITGAGTFLFGSVSWLAFIVVLLGLGIFFAALEVFRRFSDDRFPELPAGLVGGAAFVFGMLSSGYEMFGIKTLMPWGGLLSLSAGVIAFLLARRVLIGDKDRSLVLVAFFLLIVFSLMLLIHFEVMPTFKEKTFDLALKERGIDVRAQIRAGSGDLLASSLGDYWLRFNFLLFFLPVGLWLAFKKKDILSWALLLAGFLASLAADRGTRPLTFGFVIMGTLAFVNWESRYQWLLAGWMGFIIGKFGGMYSTEYAVFFPVAAILICLGLQWPRPGAVRKMEFTVGGLSLAWLGLGGYLGWRVKLAKLSLSTPGSATELARQLLGELQHSWDIPLCMLVSLLLLGWLARGSDPGRKWVGLKSKGKSTTPPWFSAPALTSALISITILSLFLIYSKPEGLYPQLYLILPPLFAVLIAVLVKQRGQVAQGQRYFWVIAVVCWLFATIIPAMNQTPKSTQSEYELYRWMSNNLSPSGKVLVPWSDGYMAEAISGIPSELSPQNIDFKLPRIYWLPEDAAADELINRGIKYIVISDRFFRLLAVNKKTGEYKFRFSPDIVYQPQQLGLNTLDKIKPTLLFTMLYSIKNLTRFKPLYRSGGDPSSDVFMVFEVLPSGS